MAVDAEEPMPTLYDSPAEQSTNDATIGWSVAVGAVLIGAAMFFLFRKIRSTRK
jgi:LPXTG-motif cell wall-anchored protein